MLQHDKFTLPMKLGWGMGILTTEGTASLVTGQLEPASIGVRLASIASADGSHSRSGLTPHHDDSDYAWWEARAPRSSVLVANKKGVAVLQGPEEAMSRMLLCPPVPMDNQIRPVSVECTFNASALCKCEVVGPSGHELMAKASLLSLPFLCFKTSADRFIPGPLPLPPVSPTHHRVRLQQPGIRLLRRRQTQGLSRPQGALDGAHRE